MKFRDTLVGALGPLWELVEPFKVHDGTIERGIPAVHDELGKYLFQVKLYKKFVKFLY